MPATATNIIAVGAWITKNSWTDLDGHPFVDFSLTIGDICTFSSPGPARNDSIKPEICAPGQMIASTLSADAPPDGPFSIWRGDSQFPNASILRDNRHAIGSGTSFSAALVTGGIALMLQKSPQANAIQIRNALIKSVKADQFTGTVPNDKWGYGKVDFVGAINKLDHCC
jgi:subtilisin family serine protease